MRKFLISAVLIFYAFVNTGSCLAQGYDNAIGVRLGTSSGITFKHALGGDAMLEVLMTTRYHGWNFTGLYEKHALAFDVENLTWYYGAGGHVGFYNGDNNDHNPWFDDDNDDDHVVVGIDGIIGLEYQIGEIPFNVGLDWKPAFNIVGYTGLWADEIAISFRYVF
jgi:hypothetical protein